MCIISIISGRKEPAICQALSNLSLPWYLPDQAMRIYSQAARKKRASQYLLFKNNLGGLDVFIIPGFDKVNSAS
jgi:hypothetical protein